MWPLWKQAWGYVYRECGRHCSFTSCPVKKVPWRYFELLSEFTKARHLGVWECFLRCTCRMICFSLKGVTRMGWVGFSRQRLADSTRFPGVKEEAASLEQSSIYQAQETEEERVSTGRLWEPAIALFKASVFSLDQDVRIHLAMYELSYAILLSKLSLST